MKKILNRKIVIQIFLIIVFVMAGVFLLRTFDNSKEQKPRSEIQYFERLLEVQKECWKYKEETGKDTPYVSLHSSVNMARIHNTDIVSAVLNAKDYLVKQKAMAKYAEKENIEVYRDEVNSFIEKSIEKAYSLDEDGELQKRCEKFGLKIEDLYWKNYEEYKNQVIWEKVKADVFEKYNNSSDIKESQLEKTELNKWRKHWQAFIEKQVDEYKKTSAFKEEEEIIDACIESIKNEESVEKIKKNIKKYVWKDSSKEDK